ncbi:MAG: hypothetical protein Kow002_06610 [Anaerolineales bacterium]
MPMNERRQLPRKYLIIYSRVFERNFGNLLGYLSDLSVSGAMIISEQEQKPNTVLPLRFDLPDLGADMFEVERMDITARVVYCQPDVSPNFYNIGFEFLEISEQQKTFIEKMMEKYEFNRDVPEYPTPPSMLND